MLLLRWSMHQTHSMQGAPKIATYFIGIFIVLFRSIVLIAALIVIRTPNAAIARPLQRQGRVLNGLLLRCKTLLLTVLVVLAIRVMGMSRMRRIMRIGRIRIVIRRRIRRIDFVVVVVMILIPSAVVAAVRSPVIIVVVAAVVDS